MKRRASVLTVLVALLYCWSANSQTPTQTPKKSRDPGITLVPQIDRAEVRVLRVEIEGNAVRSIHTHDDVKFVVFLPLTGRLGLTIGSAKPVEAGPGQAFFIEKSMPHGFRNLGSSPAMVMEVFVKDGAAVTAKDVSSFALAFAQTKF
jgi:quercetin dioxygenase-like cupin family protein